MYNTKNLNSKFFNLLGISDNYKIYNSNIGFIIIPNNSDYVFKLYYNQEFHNKELSAYKLLSNININIPNFFSLGFINNFYILKLENIRKYYKRKNDLSRLNLVSIAEILSNIHNIKKGGKSFILGDIHSSNFYEFYNGRKIELGVFDFSSSKYGEIEEDIADIYIDLGINNILFKLFLDNYKLNINFDRLYKFTIMELYERIKNGMNLKIEKRKKYYKFILKIKKKLNQK